METQGVRPPWEPTDQADPNRQSLDDLLTAVGRLAETVEQLHSNLAHLMPPGARLADRVPPPATCPDDRGTSAPEQPCVPEPALSPQEMRVLQLTSRGLSNRRIARELGLSEQTVKNYMSAVFRKIGVQSRTEAAYYWSRRNGQLPDRTP
ncbi:response regulator transcription factor [Streptomyces sp. NPDC091272]|uniref:response regulator transcription factor n=1 Tax=Streptomyces sp. NPDC091272 TaxID=3365981 RepID=UPI0037F15489